MKIPFANDYCADFIQQWIDEIAHLPERHNLDAWLTYAEQNACDALHGQSIVIEMRGLATASGRPETLTLPAECFDWREIPE